MLALFYFPQLLHSVQLLGKGHNNGVTVSSIEYKCPIRENLWYAPLNFTSLPKVCNDFRPQGTSAVGVKHTLE